MPTPIPKPIKYESPKYLAWLRTQPCCYPVGIYGQKCASFSEPHHPKKEKWGKAMGKKSHDLVAIPLCRFHHDLVESQPLEEKALDIEEMVIQHLMRYIDEQIGG